jgi:hypothetical protein
MGFWEKVKGFFASSDEYQIGKALLTDKEFAKEVLNPKAFVEFHISNTKDFINKFRK